MKIGVLALQGAVREHIRLLQQTGAMAVAVKRAEELSDLDGLVIPGGESTTIGKLVKKYELTEPILALHRAGKPIFGTCAGMILIAKNIGPEEEPHLGIMNITVKRNGFGRQRESFEAELALKNIADDYPAVFIRAPYIERWNRESRSSPKWTEKLSLPSKEFARDVFPSGIDRRSAGSRLFC